MNKLLATTLAAASLALAPLGTGAAHAAPVGPDSGARPGRMHCGGTIYATPFKRSKPMKSTCGVLGYPDAKVFYSWAVNEESESARACLEGWGFDHDHPKGGWFSLGCGRDGGAAVPWGNIADVPRVRAQSLNVPLGTYVNWAH
ncbi:MAG TPA: hypothetical protein VHL53_01310 [Acidimicrobiia bacterium]|nr:hypothetical protein [Acidimicrobiia bacterium]